MNLLPALLVVCVAVSDARPPHPPPTPPPSPSAAYPRLRRPERFDNAQQISNYLKELQDYYMVHGRGRFGKRQMHIADASVIFRDSPIFEHILDDEPFWKNLLNNNI